MTFFLCVYMCFCANVQILGFFLVFVWLVGLIDGLFFHNHLLRHIYLLFYTILYGRVIALKLTHPIIADTTTFVQD